MVFLDEMGIIVGPCRTHARIQRGTTIHDLKPFNRGAKVTAIGAISRDKLVASIAMNEDLNGQALGGFIADFLFPKL